MNQAKFEKIDGREALRRLADGETIYDSYGTRYEVVHRPVFDEVGLYYTSKDNGNAKSRIEVSVVLSHKWYIPKPFDVRQTMLDRPNEWVGAYERHGRRWFVGFEQQRMTAVKTLDGCNDVILSMPNVYTVQQSELDECIPIEDVPEEATR